ncbi:hypothetical protein LWI29_010834 [Acer saccharum]|uniref:Uncharacterized protein n=1 Tax=Acer saccharum TaxID=4024 RepID=A0AA39T5Z6_ACESA|nr:hypothetical protein LWI29_010834 [Acer saccharum]
MKDADDIEAYKKSIERLKVHIFLAGLDDEFEQVYGEFLRKESILDLEECYALVRREVVCRTTLNAELENSDTSSLLAPNRSNLKQYDRFRSQQNQLDRSRTGATDRSSYKCICCDQTSHTKSRLYELVGYPDWWDSSRDSRKREFVRNSTATIAETKTVGHEEVIEKASALVATSSNNNARSLRVTSVGVDDQKMKGQDVLDHHQVVKPTEENGGVAENIDEDLVSVDYTPARRKPPIHN